MKISGAISKSLKAKTLELCLAELHEFIPRSSPLWAVPFFQMSTRLVKNNNNNNKKVHALDQMLAQSRHRPVPRRNRDHNKPSNEQAAKQLGGES